MIGLPHTQFDDQEFSACAFTAKAMRTARMLRMRGRDVTVYWGGNRGDVSLMPTEVQSSYFGDWDPGRLPVIEWDSNLPYWQEFHAAARRELDERLVDGDIIAFVGGSIAHELMTHYLPRFTIVEPGIGYEGIWPQAFGCYESYAWMHNRYGAYGIGDHRQFDTVIPNAVDPSEWYVAPSDGYALWVGRLIHRKGPHVAAQIANAAGLKLVMAGGGVAESRPGKVVATDGTVVAGDVEHIGALKGRERSEVYAKAEVFICPTLYVGPWEGVHAEALMSGLPVVAPDAGVFTETLPRHHRYRSLADAVNAIRNPTMKRGVEWRQHAIDLCGIEVCADRYDDWFDRLDSLRDGRNGWYG
jgi:glycosyltransferase involved in cell wall biosynthesis